MSKLTADDIILKHTEIITETGGKYGVRDGELIALALAIAERKITETNLSIWIDKHIR